MKKIIPGVVSFPNGCESVRFTACLVSMLMRAEGIVDETHAFFSGCQPDGGCADCGECAGLLPIHKKHKELYHLYTAVTGFGFMQMDLSNDSHMGEDWNQTCNILLRAFDWYIGFAMDYAGYGFEELIFRSEPKDIVLDKIKRSIDRDSPVLALFGQKYQWVLITGYDESGALYGLDGSRGYWGEPAPKPTGYDENGLFYMPGWFERGGHAFILGEKKATTVTNADVFRRAIKLMESMREYGYYRRSAEFMRDADNFDSLDDEGLLTMRDRIARWIGQPIDLRAMLGRAMNILCAGRELSRETAAYRQVRDACFQTHDILMAAWTAIGEYMGGDRLEWARGLKNPVIRRMIADCFAIVCDNDDRILCALREAFQ